MKPVLYRIPVADPQHPEQWIRSDLIDTFAMPDGLELDSAGDPLVTTHVTGQIWRVRDGQFCALRNDAYSTTQVTYGHGDTGFTDGVLYRSDDFGGIYQVPLGSDERSADDRSHALDQQPFPVMPIGGRREALQARGIRTPAPRWSARPVRVPNARRVRSDVFPRIREAFDRSDPGARAASQSGWRPAAGRRTPGTPPSVSLSERGSFAMTSVQFSVAENKVGTETLEKVEHRRSDRRVHRPADTGARDHGLCR
ncbi:MAG: hypothetical protein JWN03_3078 [Nocardia sp.]|nr:hypothetical protein [Nocardia sp.]